MVDGNMAVGESDNINGEDQLIYPYKRKLNANLQTWDSDELSWNWQERPGGVADMDKIVGGYGQGYYNLSGRFWFYNTFLELYQNLSYRFFTISMQYWKNAVA